MSLSPACRTGLIVLWTTISVLLFILSVVLFILKEEGDNSSYIFITAFTTFGVSIVSLAILSFYMVHKANGIENMRKNGCCFFNNSDNMEQETDGLLDPNNLTSDSISDSTSDSASISNSIN